MKRQLSLVVSLLVLAVMVFSLAACNTEKKHEHTFGDTWSSDATSHWKNATCSDNDECKSATAEFAAHNFNGDSCSVCGYTKTVKPVEHIHSYSSSWSSDETHHWHAAYCTGTDECATVKKDEAAHDFTNGKCVCGKEAPDATDGSAEHPFSITVPGSAEIAYAGGEDLVWYTFTATETKNLKITLSSANANMAYGASATEGLTYTKGATEIKIGIEANATYFFGFCTMNEEAETFTVTTEYVVSAYDAVIGVGENNIYLSPEDIAADEATKKLVITEAGEYSIACGSVFMDKVLDADGNVMTKGTENGSMYYALEAGEYTLHFSMLTMFSVEADVAYKLNVEKYVAPEGYIVLGKIDGANAEFTYTADANGIIYITVENPVGGAVEIATYKVNDGTTFNGGNGIYVKLNEGDVVTVSVSVDEGATAKVVGQWTDADLVPENATTLDGAGSSVEPLVVTTVGTYFIPGVNSYPGKYIKYTATENVTVTFTVDVPCLWGNGYAGNAAQTVKKASLLAGESIVYIACMDYGTCDIVLTVATEEYVPESDDELEVGETANVFVDTESQTDVTFTVTESGTYIITVLGENGQLINGMTGFVLETPLTITFSDDELVEFGGSYTISYKVATVDGAAGYVEIKVEKKTEESGDNEDTITGSGSETDPYVVEGEGSEIISATKYQPVFVTIPAGFTATLDCEAQFYDIDAPMVPLGTSVTPDTVTTYLIFADSMAGCMGQLTVTVAQGGGNQPSVPEVGTGNGTVDNPYIIATPGDFICQFPGGYEVVWYGFVAAEDGKMVLSTTFGDGGWLIFGTDPMYADSNSGTGESVIVNVVAGTFYYVGVGDWNEVENTVPFSLAYSTDENEGGGSEITVSGVIYDGMVSDIDVTSEQFTAGKVYYTFCPDYTGEYTFASDLFVASVIDAAGNALERNENWCFELTAWEVYTLEISLDWISSEGTYAFEPVYQFPEGAQENPYWLEFENNVANPVAEYKGDYNAIWYQFYASADGVITVTCTNPITELFICGSFGNEIKNYDAAENRIDSVTLNVIGGRLYYIGITVGDWDYAEIAADLAFTVTLTEGEYEGNGTVNAPNILEVGSNTANIPAYEYVWYAYKFDANATLILTTDSDNCKWYLTKDLNEYVESTTDKTISIHGEWGDMVYLCMETSDMEADDIAFTASIKNDPTSVYSENEILVDGTANEFVVEENTIVNFGFYNAGQYVITWDNANAVVALDDWGNIVVLENGAIVTGAMWGTNLQVYFNDYAAGTVKITIAPYVADIDATLVLGENTITVNDTDYGDSYDLPVNETEEVTYTITVGENGVVVIDGVANFAGSVIDVTVPAGETVSVVVGAYLGWSDNVAHITVAVKSEAEPEPEAPSGPTGTGTVGDPYVISTLPNVFEFDGAHDVFVKFVASEDCSIVITYTAGCYVDNVPSFLTKDSFTKTVSGDLTAGQTFTLNLWNMSGSGKYTFAAAGSELPGEGDDNTENEGGTTAEPIATLTFVAPAVTSMFANGAEQTVEITVAGDYIIDATGYDVIANTRLQYYDAAGDTWVTIARTPGHDSHLIPYTISGLQAGTTLKLRLQCWNAADSGKEIVVTVTPAA